MTETKVAVPSGLILACPDCAVDVRIDRVSGVPDRPGLLPHTDTCPQAALPLSERIYTVTPLA